MSSAQAPESATEIEHRVGYAETDKMGMVHHSNHLVWFEMARTEHMRRTGVTYRQLEEQGVFLTVVEASVRYRAPARYDDLVRVSCWVKAVESRRVTFGYQAVRADSRELLATGETSLIALNSQYVPTRLPEHVLDLLEASPHSVRP